MATDFLIILILLATLGLGLIYLPWIILALLIFIFAVVFLQGLVEIIASFLPLFPLKFSSPTLDRFVSIHIPSFNEPADLLKNTPKHLSLLKYKNYEVIVVDNNTVDEAVLFRAKNPGIHAGDEARKREPRPLGSGNLFLQYYCIFTEIRI